MYVYIIRVYRMYMYLYIIYSYIRVPRVVARVCVCVCVSYVCNKQESLPARAKWIVCIDLLPLERRKDAKLRRGRRAEAPRGEERPEKDSVVELLSNCRRRCHSDFRKKMRIEREARRARCSGTASLRT